jgi:hypothetical protein
LGQPEKAARLFGVVDGLMRTLGFHLHPVDRMEYERSMVAIREKPNSTTWEAEGLAMSLEAAISYALE